jgi:hypothetical protein
MLTVLEENYQLEYYYSESYVGTVHAEAAERFEKWEGALN